MSLAGGTGFVKLSDGGIHVLSWNSSNLRPLLNGWRAECILVVSSVLLTADVEGARLCRLLEGKGPRTSRPFPFLYASGCPRARPAHACWFIFRFFLVCATHGRQVNM